MTILDKYVDELNTALQKLVNWPYREERNEILSELNNYIVNCLKEKK